MSLNMLFFTALTHATDSLTSTVFKFPSEHEATSIFGIVRNENDEKFGSGGEQVFRQVTVFATESTQSPVVLRPPVINDQTVV